MNAVDRYTMTPDAARHQLDVVSRLLWITVDIAKQNMFSESAYHDLQLSVETCSLMYDLAVAEDAARRSVAWA